MALLEGAAEKVIDEDKMVQGIHEVLGRLLGRIQDEVLERYELVISLRRKEPCGKH